MLSRTKAFLAAGPHKLKFMVTPGIPVPFDLQLREADTTAPSLVVQVHLCESSLRTTGSLGLRTSGRCKGAWDKGELGKDLSSDLPSCLRGRGYRRHDRSFYAAGSPQLRKHHGHPVGRAGRMAWGHRQGTG